MAAGYRYRWGMVSRGYSATLHAGKPYNRTGRQQWGAMTAKLGCWYDLPTLQRARLDSPLQVHDGVATTFLWVARACQTVDFDAKDGLPQVDNSFVYLTLPGYRATMRAVLDDAQHYVDRHPEALDHPLVVGAGECAPGRVCLRDATAGFSISIDRAHYDLVGPGDRLLAVMRHPSAYALVVRDGTVMAAIKGELAGTAAGEDPHDLLPHVRRHGKRRRE
jgi:hypothetical protein